jgi:hypothetical protein
MRDMWLILPRKNVVIGYETSQVSHANMRLQLFIRTLSILRTTYMIAI